MAPHCDSLDGPVVDAARRALASGDVTAVLPFVTEDGEEEVTAAFDRAYPLQRLGSEAAAVARRWFFETVVRVHRVGEHAGFTGLKPAGYDQGPVVGLAERAVDTGESGDVYDVLAALLHRQLDDRLACALNLEAARDGSVPAARRYVKAVLDFENYVNQVYQALHATPHCAGYRD